MAAFFITAPPNSYRRRRHSPILLGQRLPAPAPPLSRPPATAPSVPQSLAGRSAAAVAVALTPFRPPAGRRRAPPMEAAVSPPATQSCRHRRRFGMADSRFWRPAVTAPPLVRLTAVRPILFRQLLGPYSNNTLRGKALSSSLQFEPFADFFWLSALHMRIYINI